MKKGWQTKTLGEILEKTETVNPLQSPNTEFDYIDVSSVSNTTFEIEETQRLKGKDAPSRARKLVRTNDIIFATIRPTLQRIAVVPEHLDSQVCSTGYFVLRPKQGIDHRFVFYSLFTEAFIGKMESLQKGASYPAVTDGDVRAQAIPVPPLAEQQRIVGLLDEAFEGLATAKANAEKNLQNARALFESHLQSVFTQRGPGWVDTALGDVCEVIAGQSPEGKFYNSEGNGLPFYQGKKNFGEKFIEAPTTWTAQTTKVAKDGDILMSVRAPVGPVNFSTEEICIGRGLAAIRGGTQLNRDFLFYQLLHLQPEVAGKEGAVFASINKAEIEALSLSFAPLAEQQRIVGLLDAMLAETQRLARLYERKHAALEALKKSLLHQAFTGEL